MQISNLFHSLGVPKLSTPKLEEPGHTSLDKQKTSMAMSPSQEIAQKYQLNNISYDELRTLTGELKDSGLISSEASTVLIGISHTLQDFNHDSASDKINALAHFEEQVKFIKNNLGEQKVGHLNQILDTLKGLDASKKASIPAVI